MEIRFVNSGLTYRYFEVPKKVYMGLLKADSKGSYMLDQIIDFFASPGVPKIPAALVSFLTKRKAQLNAKIEE